LLKITKNRLLFELRNLKITPSNNCDYCQKKFYEEKKLKKPGIVKTGGFKQIKVETVFSFPFKCHYCNGSFCSAHRLRKDHNCNVNQEKSKYLESYQTSSIPSGTNENKSEYLPPEPIAEQSNISALDSKSEKITHHYSWKYPLKKIYYFLHSLFEM